MQKKYERWPDIVKLFACILVVLGHLFKGLESAEILNTNSIYDFLEQTVYLFHVPLFFICSGYLYQRFSSVHSISEWKDNVLKKLFSLGIPFLFFSVISWLMKNVFSSSVNNKGGSLISTLFLQPLSPYWYLYALFFIFVFFPTAKSKKSMYIMLIISIILKILTIFDNFIIFNIYAIRIVCEYSIWFVLGVCFCKTDMRDLCKQRKYKHFSVISILLFAVLSVLIFIFKIENYLIDFAVGFLACFSFISFSLYLEPHINEKIIKKLSNYFFPVYLMHTIFAAGLRIVLLKCGFTNSILHIITGIIISFLGPIVVQLVLSKIKYLDFVLYPQKYLKIGRKK